MQCPGTAPPLFPFRLSRFRRLAAPIPGNLGPTAVSAAARVRVNSAWISKPLGSGPYIQATIQILILCYPPSLSSQKSPFSPHDHLLHTVAACLSPFRPHSSRHLAAELAYQLVCSHNFLRGTPLQPSASVTSNLSQQEPSLLQHHCSIISTDQHLSSTTSPTPAFLQPTCEPAAIPTTASTSA